MTYSLKSFSDFRNKNNLKGNFDRNNYIQITPILMNLISILFLLFQPNNNLVKILDIGKLSI
jgi:hypothetical protein